MTRRLRIVLVPTLVLMILPAASAQETAPAIESPAIGWPEIDSSEIYSLDPGSRLDVDFTVGVWIPRLEGDVALGANSGNPDILLKDQFDLSDSEIAVTADLLLRFNDRWQVRASGFEFSTDTTSTFVGNETFGSLTLNDGDAFSSSLDMLSVSIEAGVDLFRPLPDPRRNEISPTTLRFTGVAGVRYLGVDQDVTRTAGGTASGSGNWVAIFGGIEMELRVAANPDFLWGRALVFDAGIAAGVDVAGGGLLVQLRTGLTLELSTNIGFFFGYRLLEVDFEDAPYGFDAGLQGLFIGGSVRF